MLRNLRNQLFNLPIVAYTLITPFNTNYISNNEPWFPTKEIYSSWKHIPRSLFIASNYDTHGLLINNNVDLENGRNLIQQGAGNNTHYTKGYETIAEINTDNYAVDKSTFIKNYKIEIDFFLSYNSWTSDWGWANPINGSDGTNLQFINRYFYSEVNSDKSSLFDEYIEHGRKTHSTLHFKLDWYSNILKIQTKLESWTWWNWGSWIKHASIMSFKLYSIKIISKFSESTLQNQIRDAFVNPYTLNTKTSPLINSDNNISANGITTSNRDLINAEIERRLKNLFASEYLNWMNRLTVEKQFINENNTVKLLFINRNNTVPSNIKRLFDNLTLKVNVNLLPEFWQKDLKTRLEIIPGKIVNPIKNNNELMTDQPEFIKQGNQEVYVYHNSVRLVFTSTSNSKEILLINGDEVEVYNNVFKIDLLDKGTSKDIDNVYEVIVKASNEVKMKLRIEIKTQINDSDFKWLGWNPEQDPAKPNEFRQWKLITRLIDNKENPLYDPTINPKTGIRNQLIFLNGKSDYPFPLDPLDKTGHLIKDSNYYNKGIIAEAMVANSGIKNLYNDKFIDQIEKVIRHKLNPQTFQIINSNQVDIKNEVQFSEPGLWHYVYYVKDYVNKIVNPKEPNFSSVPAVGGSTIHKFILIGNELEEFAQFLSQPVFFKNPNLESFWTSTAGQHLKTYLKNEKGLLETQQVFSLSYTQIIRYWKEYVSSAVMEQMERQEGLELFDLKTLKLNPIRMNVKDKTTMINQIKEALSFSIRKYAPHALYGSDYYLTNFKGENLNKIDFNDFLTPDSEKQIKKLELIVASYSHSLYVTGRIRIQLINDLKYDANKVLDLNNMKINDIKYNFFKTSEEIKNQFNQKYIKDYLKVFLDKNKPKGLNETYQEGLDYKIYFKFINQNQTDEATEINEKITLDKIKHFLNTEEYQTVQIIIKSLPQQSRLLIGETSYLIINDPDNIVAPPEPDIPIEKEVFNTRNLLWIIPTALFSLGVISFSGFLTFKRFKRKVK